MIKIDGKTIELVDLNEVNQQISPALQFDIRYARADNFTGKAVYPFAKAFLLKHVAADLLRAHLWLNQRNHGLLIFDGYRPWSVTKLFWDGANEAMRPFLANPEIGSAHNRGCAVDLSLYDLKTGKPVTMPSDFDEMNEKAYANYAGGNSAEREVRDLLKEAMLKHGFTGIQFEWWHFNHVSHLNWPVMNLTFEEVLQLIR